MGANSDTVNFLSFEMAGALNNQATSFTKYNTPLKYVSGSTTFYNLNVWSHGTLVINFADGSGAIYLNGASYATAAAATLWQARTSCHDNTYQRAGPATPSALLSAARGRKRDDVNVASRLTVCWCEDRQ